MWCHSYSACYMCICNCAYSLFTCVRDVLASYGDISVMRVYHLKMQGCGGWTWTVNCCWFNTSRPTSYYVPAPISHGVVCCVGNMRSPFMSWSRFKFHMLEMCQMWKTICSVISPLSAKTGKRLPEFQTCGVCVFDRIPTYAMRYMELWI